MASDLHRCSRRAVGPGEWQAGFTRAPDAHRACWQDALHAPRHPPCRRVAVRNELARHGLRWQRARAAVRGEPTTDAGEDRLVRRSGADVVGDGAAERRATFVVRGMTPHVEPSTRSSGSLPTVRQNRRLSRASRMAGARVHQRAISPSRPLRSNADNVHYVITTSWAHPS